MPAHGALLDDALLVLRRVDAANREVQEVLRLFPGERAHTGIRAGGHAHAAADALVVVDFHATHIVFVRGAHGAHLQTGGVFAVLARHGDVGAAEVGVRPLRAVGGIHAVGLHADVQHVHGYVVLHLAGVRAGVAPDATLKVDGDAKLGHDRSPTLS